MTDFPTYPALLEKTSILAAADLDASTPLVTAAVPIGSGTFPFEAYASGVDFYITTVDGTAAVGALLGTVQCSMDGSTWFAAPQVSFAITGLNSQEWRWSIPVFSRQWRFVRLSALATNAQSGTESTMAVSAQLRGLQKPYTITPA